jgi:LPXTG-motif cell wall-anchored protein
MGMQPLPAWSAHAPRQHRRASRRTAATLATALSLLLAMMVPAFAGDHSTPGGPAVDEDGKVLVCKYVRMPGEAEQLQNLISVDASTLRNVDGIDITNIEPYDSWTDGQNRSVVIAPGGTEADCPPPTNGDPDPELSATGSLGQECVEDDLVVTGTIDHTDADGEAAELRLDGDMVGDATLQGDGQTTLSDDSLAADATGTYTLVVDGDTLATLEVTNDCAEDETPEPEPGSVTVVKAWEDTDGVDGFDATDIDITFTANIDDGDDIEVTPDTPVELEHGQTLTVTDEDATGLPEGCTYTNDIGDGAAFASTEDDPDGTITVTNAVTCVEAGEQDRQPSDREPADRESADRQVAGVVEVRSEAGDGTEVLGVTIESDEQELPRTGAPLPVLLLVGLLSTAFGGALLRKRS